MSPSLDGLRLNKRIMAYTAAAMYGGAAFDGLIVGFLPGDPSFAITPVIVSVATVALLCLSGPHVPRRVLAPLGPLGVVLIAYAVSTTPGARDGAVLYMWPVLWSTFYFGRRGAIVIVACVAVAHAVTLLALPATSSYPGRGVDVMVSVSVVARVVLTLVRGNDLLLTQLAGEARTDKLTSLLNRRGFNERAELELARARREGSSIAIAANGSTGLPAVRVSAGMLAAVAPEGIETMLQGADFALYRAKRAGRDRTVVFERSVSPFATHRTNTSHDQVPV